MDNNKSTISNTYDPTKESNRIVNNHDNPINTTSSLNSLRTYGSPLMGTSARAARRRLDGDTGPVRIDGTDTFNQQLQHHYQNVRQVLEEKQPNQTSSVVPSNEIGQTFGAKRDFFEQHFKSSPSTYDSPPRDQQPAQKIITTITTTTSTTPTVPERLSASFNELPPSVNAFFEQAAELQKLTNLNSNKSDSPSPPLVIERTEQYQLFLDPTNQDIRRTPTIPIAKTSHASNLDQAQTKTDRFADDHRTIQQLARTLQEHNVTTATEYKRLPSQSMPILINTTTTTTTTIPSSLTFIDRTHKPLPSGFAVLDALLNNPVGTNDAEQNKALHSRSDGIVSSLRDVEYVRSLKRARAKKATKKRRFRRSKPSYVDKQTQSPELPTDSSLTSVEQTPLVDSNESKKETKKEKKRKAKQLANNTNYQAIDALINSPISPRVTDSDLTKYRSNLTSTQLSPVSSIPSKDILKPMSYQVDSKARNEAAHDLDQVFNEILLHHHTAALTTPVNTTQQASPHRNDLAHQQGSPKTGSVQPRIVYRYLDDQGNVLKLSSTPPSQLRESVPEQTQQEKTSYRETEPIYSQSRKVVLDEERCRLPSDRNQRTATREDSQSRDKHKSQLGEQRSAAVRSIPISIEPEYATTRTSSRQRQHTYDNPNTETVKLNWLPSAYHLEPQYMPSSIAGYDTDSSVSGPSPHFRHYDYAPTDSDYRYTNRPLHQSSHPSNRSPDRVYHPSSSRVPFGNRDISPDYVNNISNVPRNYIEVFRGGDSKPSEVYSLPFNQPPSASHRHSRYDQYQSEKQNSKVSSSSIRDPYADQSSPNRGNNFFDDYVRQSTASDYRPLRTKLQREYKITPSLLLDEWDYPEQSKAAGQKPTNGTNGNSEQQTRTSRPDPTDSHRQQPEHQTSSRLNSPPIFKALALHSFYAQTSRELSFKKGDILLVLRRINEDWLEGEHQGSVGIFPLNHVELFRIDANERDDYVSDSDKEHGVEGEAIVKYDFIPQKTFELQLRKGDKVVLLRRIDKNWYEGRLNHIEGIFPAAYVETLREPPEVMSTKKSPPNERVPSSKETSPELERTSSEREEPIPTISLPMRKCQVLYDYIPENPDELEIHVGDIINVIEMCDDGWYCGMMEKPNQQNAMEFGTFPGNYVKLLSV